MTENQKKHANGWSWDKPEKLSYLKIVGFLQLTAELLIGAEDRAFIVHLAPNHHCSMSLQQILGLFDPRYLCMVVEALCLPPTYKNHPVHCLYRIWQRHAPWPDDLTSWPIWIKSRIADGLSIGVA